MVVKTTDDYLLRLFCIAFTKRRPNQIRKTTYARSSQIKAIRKKMTDIMTREAQSCTLSQLTTKLIPEVIGREIEKSTQGIYPLQNVRWLGSVWVWDIILTFTRSTCARSSSSSHRSSTLATCSRSTASPRLTTLARRLRTVSSRRRFWRACKRLITLYGLALGKSWLSWCNVRAFRAGHGNAVLRREQTKTFDLFSWSAQQHFVS